MSKIKKVTLVLIVLFITNLMIATISYGATGTITTDTLRMRKSPTTDANILKNLDKGDSVEIIEKVGDWYKIKYEGNEGYINSQYVKVNGEVTENKGNETTGNNTNTNPNNAAANNGEVKLTKNSNMHILPTLISSKLITINEEASLVILETINNWSRIECNGVTGWVLNNDILNFDKATNGNQKPNTDVETKKGYVNVSSANVRTEASKTSAVLTTLTLNKELTILEKTGDWYKIETTKGQGYIFAELVSDKPITTSRSSVKRTTTNTTAKAKTTTPKTEQNATKPTETNTTEPVVTGSDGAALATFAKALNGKKYVYGGSGPNSFDCSGFTMYVYKKFGVSLPHNAVTQARYGTSVKKSELQAGDLVIFNNSANTSIGHAGIYIGGGKFIHAANSKRGVVIDSVSSSYYDKRFVDARRLV